MDESPPTGGFLPPEPSGPEPDLGPRRPSPPQPEPASPQQPAPAWNTAAPSTPDNGPAVLGFCLSLSSAVLLLLSGGLSSLISVGLAIPGMLQSRKGSRRIQEGHTDRNGSLAGAGFVIGIVALVLSVLATIFWVVIAVLVATNEDARREFEREFDRQYHPQRSSVIPILLAVTRLLGAVLS